MNIVQIRSLALSWLEQCLLRRAPQADPLSYSALSVALLGYAVMDLLHARASSGWLAAVAMTVMDIMLMLLFVWTVLRLANKSARLVQTLTSLAGTGTVLGLVALPLVVQAARAHQDDGPDTALVLGWLVLFVWSISVQAHIYRHALSARYGIGLLVAGAYVVIAISLVETLFPRVAGG